SPRQKPESPPTPHSQWPRRHESRRPPRSPAPTSSRHPRCGGLAHSSRPKPPTPFPPASPQHSENVLPRKSTASQPSVPPKTFRAFRPPNPPTPPRLPPKTHPPQSIPKSFS